MSEKIERIRLRIFQRLWLLCVMILATAIGVTGVAAAQPALSMGPLSEFLFEGRDGKWQAAIRDGSFVLSNESDPAAVFYLYAKAGVVGDRKIRVEVKADWGESSRRL